MFSSLQDRALMLRSGERQLLVSLDESEHGIIVWRRVIACNVAVDATLGCGASLRKFLDQLIPQELICRRGLDELQKKLCRGAGLFYAPCQL